MLILLTAMAVLLPLLAALQYYWLGQVSEGASDRLRSSLRASATGFRHDFNREFIRAHLNFHMDSFAPPDDIERYHVERLEQWNQTAPYPRLISDVFVVNYDEEGHPRLSRLDAQAGRFELAEWSGELVNLRDRFERQDESSHLGVAESGQNSLESFAEEIPALIVPFPFVTAQKPQNQAGSTAGQSRSGAKSPPLPPGFTVIKLDLNYMQREFIPTLIQRHLFDDSHTGYNVAIISLNHPERVIYSSRNPMVDFASSDVSTRIFGLEADELRTFLSSEGMSPAGAQPATRQLRLINLRYLKGPSVVPSMSAGEEDGRWQLLIKHQAGSLAAAVSSARHRNLAISFGILLLLAAGILMTAISTRRAERLARQQINFVAGVTHELRTPLAVICSAGENLADGIVDTPQKAAHYGQVIYREGRRLAEMVEQVLEFAGAQSGQRRYELRSTKVADFVAGALAACQAQIQESDFSVETVIEENLPPVRGDGAALKRAVQNLISNAIKYDCESRWARISAQVWARSQGDEVRITVEDRGLGISSVDIARIFEPFYRGDEAVAAQIKGSGVGLSLVKQIVEAHGGRVSVKSTPGAGSVFTLHLPIAAHASESKDEVRDDNKS
jgi:signal transduction histidine kinase